MKMVAGTEPGNGSSASAGANGDNGRKRSGGTPVVAVAPAGNGSIAHSRHQALLSGNEAIGLAAWHAGADMAVGYPGTPSTEVLEYIAKITPESDIYVEWSTNEKVAMDVAMGASLAGKRVIVTTKHVGLNVALDSLMTSPFIGVNGGVVVFNADDPGMHSSQNEQDNRYIARFAGIPLLEPSDSQEAYDFTRAGFGVSEQWDTPVILRTTTRTSHALSRVIASPAEQHRSGEFRRDPRKYVMLPANARPRHVAHLERLSRMERWAEEAPFNREELRSKSIGVIASGMSYQYVRDVLPHASVFKLGLTFPLPKESLTNFASKVDRLFVVEELEPYLEEALKLLGVPVEGKEFFPRYGELSPHLVRVGFQAAGILEPSGETAGETAGSVAGPSIDPVGPRFPLLCSGCSHATTFFVLRELDAVVTGDIGCYTLGATDPLSAMDTCLSMGSSVGMAVGLAKAGSTGGRPVVAVLGDSTFLHAGIPPLIDAVHREANLTVVILDNGTTAMTGGQPNPANAVDIRGGSVPKVDIPAICKAIGVASLAVVDPYDVGATRRAIENAISKDGVSVVVTVRACAESPEKIRGPVYYVDIDSCDGCQLCMNLGCPALVWDLSLDVMPKRVRIDATLCSGCTVCAQICPQGAIFASSSQLVTASTASTGVSVSSNQGGRQ
ncbi:MAG: indolepyruvate ferredoxin oxidoreductase subunit alpha [Actinobacteria bacterium]|nr:indolepyruvate ferredoxin oxidoreductase subunit alpha [Actinomycetota bacterium]MCL5447278.1 indolepyruvate ferredoxin oxidoreductase subunit alpha [Actinomycetota bacterium]